jgi:hypothetical protein
LRCSTRCNRRVHHTHQVLRACRRPQLPLVPFPQRANRKDLPNPLESALQSVMLGRCYCRHVRGRSPSSRKSARGDRMRTVESLIGGILTFALASGVPESRAYPLNLSSPAALSAAVIDASAWLNVTYVCHRWWQWHGARWVRTCWPAGQEPPYGPWNGPGWYGPSVYDVGWFRPYRW